MAAASRDVNKWKRNLTQEMSTEPEDKSEPDEPEFETSFRFQQEGDLVAVYNVEDFFISEVIRVISEEEAIVNFLEKAAVKMELLCTGGHALKITLKSPCTKLQACMFMDDKGDTAVPCFLSHTRPFSAVKSEDFADFKTLTLKISANAAASVLHT